MSDSMKPLIYAASEGPLGRTQAEEAFNILFDGTATPAQMGGFLMALRARGEAVAEYTAAAAVMRARCAAVIAPPGSMDIVGTGGDGMGTLNISTPRPSLWPGPAFLSPSTETAISRPSPAPRICMPPWESRSWSAGRRRKGAGRSWHRFHDGSDASSCNEARRPGQDGTGFQDNLQHSWPADESRGRQRQLTGAFAIDLIFPMAEVLKELGSEEAWLVHGADGTDEMSICGPTSVAVLKDGKITSAEMHPEDAGLPVHPLKDILGGSPGENAAAFRALLDGAPGAYRDAVLLNAAAALVIAGKADHLKSGVEIAADSIASGAARAKVEGLARVTSGPDPHPARYRASSEKLTGSLGAWAELPFFKEEWPRIAEALSADPRRILPPAQMRFAALNGASRQPRVWSYSARILIRRSVMPTGWRLR